MNKAYELKQQLGFSTKWCVDMPSPDWDLNTVVIDSPGELLCSDQRYPHITTASNGTVAGLWAAAEQHYQHALKEHGDIDHAFLERARLRPDGTVEFFFGS